MKRYKSIDFFRGFCMFIMIAGHMLDWWLLDRDMWFYHMMCCILGTLGASGFVFVSGVSTIMSYKKGLELGNPKKKAFMQQVRNVYMIRAIIILIIGFFYNFFVAIYLGMGMEHVWTWMFLQTIGFCLILSWPLLKMSIGFRIIAVFIIFIANQLIYNLLSPFMGESNLYGVLYHIFFNKIQHYVILPYLSIFLVGTVIGEIIYDVQKIKDEHKMQKELKSRLSIIILIGIIILVGSILYNPQSGTFTEISSSLSNPQSGTFIEIGSIPYYLPSFFTFGSFASHYYSIGLVLIFLSVIILNEEFDIITTKKRYTCFSQLSYYSFSIYLTHFPIHFLFYRQLDIFWCWTAIFFSHVFLISAYYFLSKKVGKKASLKYVIGQVAFELSMRIEKRKKRKKKILREKRRQERKLVSTAQELEKK